LSVLLDANALIALCWPQHEFHGDIQKWFRANARKGWATCALTQSAFIRVSMQPHALGHEAPLDEISTLLAEATQHSGHRSLSILRNFSDVRARCTGGLVGHRQITDAWLLASAIANEAKLLTFDRGMSALLATDEERARHVITLAR
jgi:uncharacterized protein